MDDVVRYQWDHGFFRDPAGPWVRYDAVAAYLAAADEERDATVLDVLTEIRDLLREPKQCG